MTRSLLQRCLPRRVSNYYQWAHENRRLRGRLRRLSVKEVFTLIYVEHLWGRSSEKDGDGDFFSGSGSHDALIVETYVAAVVRWISGFSRKPDVVDLGCGDFAVGAQVRHLCGNYIACDVVEPLIQRNEKVFKDLNVDFRVVDLIGDELPDGQVAFLRQVLQHLPNRAISAIVPKLQAKYDYLVLTEHLMLSTGRTGNADKPVGPDWRGVVLTAEPFNLDVREGAVICEAPEQGGVIRTNVYRLQ